MRRTSLALGLSLWVCACGKGGPGPGPGSSSGSGDAACQSGSCSSGFTCDWPSQLCVPLSACSSGSCLSGLVCSAVTHRCTADPICNTDAQCPAGWTCSSSVCVASGSAACADQNDCPQDRLCSPYTRSCISSLNCELKTCPGGWECDSTSNICQRLPPEVCSRQEDCLAPGERCVDGRCVGCATTGARCTTAYSSCDPAAGVCRTCQSAADCPAGLVCTPQGCAECGSADDCPGDRPVCQLASSAQAGTCVECSSPGTTAGCATGQKCTEGYLCTAETFGYTCYHDSDCQPYPDTPHCGVYNECVQCTADEQCAALKGPEFRCQDQLCHRVPKGDVCGDPIDVALTGDRTELLVSLGGFGCELGPIGSCIGSDAFYRFSVTQETKLTVYLDASDGFLITPDVTLLGSDCSWRLDHIDSAAAYRQAVYLPPGTWILRFDGGLSVKYVVVLETSAVDLSAGNSCASPVLLPQSATGASVYGSTTGFLPTAGDYCSRNYADKAPTAVYALDLAQQVSQVAITATPLSAGFSLDLDVKDACPSESFHSCAASPGHPVTRTFAPMPAGTHYVVVDAENGTSGDYRLDVTVTP
jgi:hypothetical protein